jgi:hypothetical protein
MSKKTKAEDVELTDEQKDEAFTQGLTELMRKYGRTLQPFVLPQIKLVRINEGDNIEVKAESIKEAGAKKPI